MTQKGLRLAVLGCLLSHASAAAGNETLQFFDEEALVMTASRRPEPARRAPMSIEVITAEDIRASGAVNLWDLLRFRAGMDVEDAQTDGLAVVSIRGFARTSVRQLLVLIDGRSVYSPARSAVNWEQLPVQLQDVERIEVVRGPNGVFYGSNAGLGVINIITKQPAAKREASAGGLAGSESFLRTEAAAQESIKDFHFRLSQTHTSRAGTSLPGGGDAGDFLFSNKQNFRGRWEPSPQTSLDLFAGGSWDTLGRDANLGGSAAAGQNRYRGHFETARLKRELSAGELELSGSRSEVDTEQEKDIGLVRLREVQYDAEVLYRLNGFEDRLHTAGGASHRLAAAASDQMFAGAAKQQNRIWRGFVHQSAQLTETFALAGGVSLEHSDTAGYEPAYQLAAIITPAAEHAVRLSYSFAPTLPSLFDKHANSLDSATKRRVGGPSLDADHLSSYEVGYEGTFRGRLTAGANLFYLDHRDLNESVFVSKVGKLTTTSFDNNNAALARGAEALLKYHWSSAGELYANYTYEHVTDRSGNMEVTRGIPGHKFNLGGRAALGRGFSLGADLGYKDAYAAGSPTSGFVAVPAYWRLDGRLSYSPSPNLQVFIGGQNLTRPFHCPEFQKSEAVPRTYQGGGAVKF